MLDVNFWSSKPWIRIVIQAKMLDPDPNKMKYGFETLTSMHLVSLQDFTKKKVRLRNGVNADFLAVRSCTGARKIY